MKTGKMITVTSGIIAVLVWFVLFGLGMFISSKPYRDALVQNPEWASFFISLLTYTPTNIAFLSLAAAFCGGCSSNLSIAVKIKINETQDNSAAPEIISSQNPFNCMLRGFVVYIAFLAGMYIIVNAPFAAPTQEEYARAAGVVSLLAYVTGYDQSNFLNLISLSSKLRRE